MTTPVNYNNYNNTMKSFLSLLFALSATAVLHAAASTVLTVAVFDFATPDPTMRDDGPKIAALLNASLSAEPNVNLVERAELDKSLGEMELGLSGTVSPDSAAKVGHLTGAQVLVTGRAFNVDKTLVIVAKIIGVETSRVYGEVEKGPPGQLPELTARLAKKIAADLAEKAGTLIVSETTREERLDKVIKNLAVARRPVVSVNINERHFGAAVIDPAAETEFGLILQKAGFTLVDEKSDQKADVEITGEAFSAFGLRKGNLISCRSRLEITARQRTTGKIIAVDRQTSVAVDIAEQIAAKTALQNATQDLAQRLLPKLAAP